MSPKRLLIVPATVALGVGLAACGGSSNGIVLAPSGGQTEAAVTAAAPTTSTPTTSTASVTTPAPPSPLSKKPVVTVPTGPAPKKLVVKDLIVGHGKAATASSTVTVNYVGVLYKNGKEFDSSWKRGQPATFPLNGVIPGWTQGLPGMKVGGRRELIIPPSLGYKNQPQSGIPANSTLVFVIDLLSVS
jgi:FKBP-type peptidyl-prolyl cis-trans isomerase